MKKTLLFIATLFILGISTLAFQNLVYAAPRCHGAHCKAVKVHRVPPGWHHGKKVGWRGLGAPPGQIKKR